MDFNPAEPVIMHLDINACFATIEQQANPYLRGKPVAVAAYTTPSGCILAASYEAKRLGIKTGMRVKDGLLLSPKLVVLAPDPPKYRFIHLQLKKLLNHYSDKVIPKSIDEFTINFSGAPILETKSLWQIALEIKAKIKAEIGEAITLSIGIAPNRFLAKTAASYRKPDGLFEISETNFQEVYKSLKLTDLCGIKRANANRFAKLGVYSITDLYNFKNFKPITNYYWYLRLHGYETDDTGILRKSFGNSYALPRQSVAAAGLLPILSKLVQKMASRLRKHNYTAQGVHLGLFFSDYTYWHKGIKLPYPIFASSDFYKEIYKIFLLSPQNKLIKNIAVSCFNLQNHHFSQLDLNRDVVKKENLTEALDAINNKFGNFTVIPARMINLEDKVIDRIAFGGMSEI